MSYFVFSIPGITGEELRFKLAGKIGHCEDLRLSNAGDTVLLSLHRLQSIQNLYADLHDNSDVILVAQY